MKHKENKPETPATSPATIGYTEPDDFEGWESCGRCGGTGELLICCDDICHGLGECIHGDGMAVCPDCKGSGEV